MLKKFFIAIFWLCWISNGSHLLQAQVGTSQEDLDFGPNRADEPLAQEFSLTQTVKFLDATALNWQRERNCMTCHTNYAYLYARPAVAGDAEAHRQVRRYADQMVQDRWQEKGPRWDAEVVATAAALAFNDSLTTGDLASTTQIALDRMWTVQRDDGGFSWLKCGWPPMESDDHYGVTLAAIAVGVAPQAYRETASAQTGLQKIRQYFQQNPPETLHHRAMMLWAGSYVAGLVKPAEQEQWIKDLTAKQKADGGWALAELGQWDRADGSPQDTETSDGYATAFVIYVLRRAEVPIDAQPIQDGVNWLKTHQRQSGRWFTRSLNRDNKHFISHAGTAMALMALTSCGETR